MWVACKYIFICINAVPASFAYWLLGNKAFAVFCAVIIMKFVTSYTFAFAAKDIVI